MEVTLKMRFKEILSAEEFREFRQYLNPFKGIRKFFTENLRMRQFNRGWKPEHICDGFAYLLKRRQAGEQIYYPIYDKEQAEKDPGLKEQVIFHFAAEKKSRFVVICAGGGYRSVCSMVEAFPAAKRLNELGYHVFAVNYRVGKQAFAPNPQDDLANAVRYILNHSVEFNIQTDDYAVMGFSAGGHLAASFGTQNLGYARYGLPKPGVLFLAYPVITMGRFTHAGSRRNLLGRKNIKNEEMIRKYSIENHITPEYPPTFVWQCDKDKTVPVENTQMLVQELDKAGISYFYKTYSSDAHGWGGGDGTLAEGWIAQAVAFWGRQK